MGELETAVDRCRAQRWRPRREHTQQLSNLLAASQVLRRAAHKPPPAQAYTGKHRERRF
ncbi:hypothetical protein OHA18_06360 [Kribbella sp. NBC_00709]|uniref:hypothetical protein n=1 Tax=Kribbella sp. NBC_00709 TaxID=2975972 RepID=UPI002E28B8EF|nr:hypothetical protein [Kribbella sp. NBC_00709]